MIQIEQVQNGYTVKHFEKCATARHVDVPNGNAGFEIVDSKTKIATFIFHSLDEVTRHITEDFDRLKAFRESQVRS